MEPTGRSPQGAPQARNSELSKILLERRRKVRAADRIPRRAPDVRVPLSYAQEQIWFLEQLAPGGAAYHIARSFALEGPLDPAALARSLGAVVARHEALRTSFAIVEGQPVQAVAAELALAIPVLDLRVVPEPAREEEARRLEREEVLRPFDLARGPVLRLTLLRLADERSVLLLTLHHIAVDGWSLGILLRELGDLYRAFAGGVEPPPQTLPALPIQYADFALWQRERLAGDVLEKLLAFWRTQLEGAPPVLALPTDRPRPPVQSFRGAGVRRVLPPELAARLRSFGEAEGATPFMALLAAFQALLVRHTGQEDLVVGTPVAGRSRSELEGLIGLFINMLVLRTSLASDPGLRELTGRVRTVTLSAYAHKEMPFEKLVAELSPERDLGHAPVFQVLFVLQSAAWERLDLPGIELAPREIKREETKVDLMLAVHETGDGLALALQYDRDLFDGTTMMRLAAQYEELLSTALADPERPLSGLPALLPAERHQVVREWNDTAAVYGGGCLHELIAEQAARTPDAPALVFEGESLAYAEVERRANHLAWRLRELGVGPEVRVAVQVERSLELPLALLAVLKAGGAYVPLDPSYPKERLDYMLADSRAAVHLTRERVLGLMGESGRGPDSGVQPENLAYVIYTSGSTGRPKGAMNSHRGIVNRLLWGQAAFGLEPSDRVMQKTPASFDVSVWEFFWPLVTGACLVLARPGGHQDSAYLVELIRRERLTTMHFVPSMLQVFLEQPGVERCTSLKRVVCSGEALPADLVRRYFERLDAELINLYGPTETAIEVTCQVCRRDDRIVPIGRPIGNLSIHIVDRCLRTTPLGVAGELLIGGVGVGRGYLERPELTAERFVPGELGQRLYRTGDLARHLGDGRIEYLGRIDHQVKVRGFRIELQEIEAALMAEPEVREAAVVVKEESGDRRLVAYVVGTDAGLKERLRARLPEYMVPAAIVVLDALPLSPSGKVDRGALSKLGVLWAAAPEQGYVAPRTPLEAELAGMWSVALGIEKVGVHDNFFELGGSSITGAVLINRLQERLGEVVHVAAIFDEPTVAGLAAWLGSRSPEAVERIWGIAPAEWDGASPLPLSFAQERLWFLDQLEPGNPFYNLPAALRLAGALDVAALRRSFDAIVRRHQALRTRFTMVEGEPAQVVVPELSVPLPVVDLAGLPEALREGEARRLAGDEERRPFDLARGPLLRTALLRLGGGSHVLLLCLHHIVSDGWSMGVLVQELAAHYGSSPLAELPVQYADFAVWQRARLAGKVLEDELAWWRERLAGAPALLELPADRPRPAVQTFRGRRVERVLPAPLSSALAALARRRGATLFMALLSAFDALLARVTGQSDLVVGSPIAGRTRAELEGLIGFFVNTLVLRTDVSGDPAFARILERVQQAAVGAYAHQELPFEKLVAELAPVRTLAHAPLFQVMLVLQNAPWRPQRLGEARLSVLSAEGATAKLDLLLSLAERSDQQGGLTAAFQFNSDLFDASTMARFADQFRTLVEGAVADPAARLSDLPLLPAAARAQLLREWNDTAVEVGGFRSLPERIAEQAARTPGAVAVLRGDASLTYAELERRANRLAWHLRSLGVEPETRVAISMERTPDLLVALLGVLKAGGAYVPIDPSYPEERRAFMLADSGVSVVLDGSFPASEPEGEAEAPPLALAPENLAYVLYTSGSTGRPKGVQVPHGALVNLLSSVHLDATDTVLAVTTLSFDIAATELFLPLLVGARVVLADREDARDGARLAALCESATLLQSTPAGWQVLLDSGWKGNGRLRALTAGEPLSRDLADRLLEETAELWNLYGPTEATVYCTAERVMSGRVTIGRPLANYRVHVLDPDLGLAPVGVTGEIAVGGAGLARGYAGRSDLTAERFVPDPFGEGERLYRTGDLGRLLPDGRVDVLGRIDHQVKVRGFRIELQEVEAALARHPDVREAVALARDGRLVAFVVVNAGREIGSAALRSFAAGFLPEFMVPSLVVALPAFPLTPNGKVDRKALAGLSTPVFSKEAAAPRSPVEEVAAGIWREVLKLPAVGIDDDFFELGGHSLLATQVVSRAREAFGVELPVRSLFESKTLSAWAGQVERALRAGRGIVASPIEPAAWDGVSPFPLSFAQERLWLLDRLEPGSTAYNIPSPMRLRGALNVAALERALDEILRRHEALRTTFAEQDGEPVQIVAPPEGFRLPVTDLSHLAEEERRAEGDRLIAEHKQPFDLERGPLFRAGLVRLGGEEHLLLLDVSHIVSDGWSLGIFFRELGALYGAFVEGRPSPLPELPVQYADFAAWQREWLQGPVLDEQLAYWRERLAGSPPALELPVDRLRPPVQTHRGDIVPGELPAVLTARLRELSLRERTSLFMTLLAAFQLLLSRLAGQDDVVVGSPSAGRSRVEVEDLIGLFLNTLVLRTDLSGDPTFHELLGRVREAVLGAYRYQAIPFELLLEELQPERQLSRTPIFQVLFNYVSLSDLQPELPGLRVEAVRPGQPDSKFDFTLYVNETPKALRLNLVYNADLFDRGRMEEMLRQLELLLDQASANPEARIGSLSLVTPASAALLPDPARSLSGEWRGPIHQALSRNASGQPDRIAVQDAQGTVWTYAELEARTNRLARFLISHGVEKGDAVAVWAHRSAPLVQALMGTLKAGAAFMVLDPAYPMPRLLDYLRIGRPTAWVTVPGAPAPPAEVVEAASSLCRVDLDELSGVPDTDPGVAVGPDDAACITFTSGSTGMPKGVVGRHGPLTHFYPWMAERFGLGADDRFGMLSALSHDPLQRDVFTPVWFGAGMVLPDPDRIGAPGYLAGWLRNERVTVLHLTPAMMEMVLDSTDNGPERIPELPHLRRAFVVGDLLKKGDVEHLQGIAPSVVCVNLYGSTETQRSVSFFEVPRDGSRLGKEVLPLGRGMEGCQLLVLNRAGRLAGIGEAGEIHLRSRNLSLGYLGDEALTAERFLPNPLVAAPDERDRVYKTGDLGRYLPDGGVEFAGRADFQVKLRGFRIELGEVEAALARYPGVRECVVIVREDRPGDRRLVGYLVAADAAPRDLRAFLAARLPDYMVPSSFVTLPALPLTRTGKVDRRALPPPIEERREVAEKSPVEELLAGIWCDLLGVSDVAPGDSFFELGGQSLLATRMISRVRTVLGVDLPMRAVFEEPTLAGVAAFVERAWEGGAQASMPLVRVPRTGPLPASFAQQRLWFLDQLEPGSVAYNLSGGVRLSGPLDVPALTEALSGIVRRHESLRTVFVEEDGQPRQVIGEPAALPVAFFDLSGLPAAAREEELRRVAAAEARRPYDLARGPLVRCTLVRLDESEHALLVGFHHIVADGWSLGIFVRELGALYRGEALSDLPIQYADYAAWQRDWLRGEVLEERLAWWKFHLGGAPQVVELPLDHPRPAVQSYHGRRAYLALDSALEPVARRLGATPFMILLGAFTTLLARYGSQPDVVVGTPIANRGRAEFEDLIGMFANTLALRVDLSGDPGFGELARRVREVALGAYAHQDIPFERLVDELKPERDLSHSPVFQVMLALQNLPDSRLDLAGLALSPLEFDISRTQLDLSLFFFPRRDGGLLARLEYRRDLFEPVTAARFVAQFKALLAGALADPDTPLPDLPLLDETGRHQLVCEWNDTAVAYGPAACLHELIAEQAARTPEAPALVFEEESLTYAELVRRANNLAWRLRELGVGPEVRVAVEVERSLELPLALLAVLKAGGAYVPLDPSYPQERLDYMLSDSRAAVHLTRERVLELMGTGRGDTDDSPNTGVQPENLAYIIYTSGSTGRPKGAMNSHRGIVNRLRWMQSAYGLDSSDRVLQKTPASFDVSVWEFFWPLLTGACLVVAKPGGHQDSAYLVDLIRRERVTTLHFVPSMLQVFVDQRGVEQCTSLRRVVCSGEALPADLVRRFFEKLGAELHNLYGPTEAAVDVTYQACRRDDRTVPIGRPIANLSIHVVDRSFRPVPLGVPGELLIGGVGVGRGYLDRPDLTAERFVPGEGERLYRTGDLARHLGDGRIEFLGRLDHQVKVRGFRIELQEVEAALTAHPAVREALVVPWEQTLAAYVIPRGEVDPAELRDALRRSLPDFMVPASFTLLPAFPLNPSGKADRGALPKPERPKAGGGARPRSETERALAAIWCEVLSLPDVPVTESFFGLGGHSLLLARVERRIREEMGREVPLLELFRHPTIETLAAFLTGGQAVQRAAAPASSAATGSSIAIVGMAGRFPGAGSVEELWRRLCRGDELVTFLSDEELLAAGVPRETLADPRYVRARGVLDGSDRFAASFFEVSPREAEIMDPQQRVFLECAWEALEDAGVDPSRFPGRVAVFAGATENSYVRNLQARPETVRAVGPYQASLLNRGDYLPTRVSYKLDLRGPSLNVQTACSTSLVAVHLACRSLLEGECEAALAGGVSVAGTRRGYVHEEGGIASPDGHTRTFSARGRGTIAAEGAGIVVLKRLEDALESGDRIYAVLRATALNNDGANKIGFTAPSIDGQAAVIAAAQEAAGVDPETLGYVEAHGTATELGDPIEMAALTQAFRTRTDRSGYCAIGSIKSNLGHLDAAAGVAGLIKAALAVERGEIPPSLHFDEPNPRIDFASSPFYVQTALTPWPDGNGPRRAAVSSFGIGGTNAHAILEQAPACPAPGPSRRWHLLPLSAKTPAALDAACARLADHLERHPGLDLADVAWTLQVGRKAFAHRRIVVAGGPEEAIAQLRESGITGVAGRAGRRVFFLFPGQGSQHAGMAMELYREEPVFREHLDRCLGPEILAALETGEGLLDTSIAQPALFAVEYSLARLWMSWGIAPAGFLGHSIGEYVAACLAGVFTLEQALSIVSARGRLMQQLPEGAMLAVSCPEEVIRSRGFEIAAVNAPGAFVVSGPVAAIEALERELPESRRLFTRRAFHSAMTEPVLEPFARQVGEHALGAPAIPFVSNLSGTWITEAEAADPGYWARHLRGTVRFGDGVRTLLEEPDAVLLEVGPRRTLAALARRQAESVPGAVVLSSLATPGEPVGEEQALLSALGRLWLSGVEVDWAGVNAIGRRRRVPLPTYPFERGSFWVAAPNAVPPKSAAPEPPAVSVPASTGTEMERRIAGIWRELLGIARIEPHDNFFELGGSSLLAVRLGSHLRRELGVEVAPHLLLAHPTLGSFASAISPGASAPEASGCLVAVQPRGRRPPLFLVHPAGGHVYLFRELGEELGEDQPLYGLRALGLEPGETPAASVEEMAERYLAEIRAFRPAGPYLLGGSSMGGMIAWEMAQRLAAAGEQVPLLALFDTFGPGQLPDRKEDGDLARREMERSRPGGPLADINPEARQRLRAVVQANVGSMYAYGPRRYPGKLVFFRADDRGTDPPHPERPWIELARGGTEIHPVPGDHVSLHARPHVAAVAGRLARCLDAVLRS